MELDRIEANRQNESTLNSRNSSPIPDSGDSTSSIKPCLNHWRIEDLSREQLMSEKYTKISTCEVEIDSHVDYILNINHFVKSKYFYFYV